MADELYHFNSFHDKLGRFAKYQNRDGSLTTRGHELVNKKASRKEYRHINNSGDDYVLKKGTRGTRVIKWDWMNEGTESPSTKKEAEENEKKYKTKYVSVDDVLKRGANGTDFYLNWFGDSGAETEIINYEIKKDVTVANGRKVIDFMLNKYGDMTVNELGVYLSNDERRDFGDALVKNVYKDADIVSKDKYLRERAAVGERVLHNLKLKTAQVETNELAKYFSQKGYGAFEDINDSITDMPVVFIDGNKFLKKTFVESSKDYIKRKYGA